MLLTLFLMQPHNVSYNVAVYLHKGKYQVNSGQV